MDGDTQKQLDPVAEMLAKCDAVERLAYRSGQLFMLINDIQVLLNASKQEEGRAHDILRGLAAAKVTQLGMILADFRVDDEALAPSSASMRTIARAAYHPAVELFAAMEHWADPDYPKPDSQKPS